MSDINYSEVTLPEFKSHKKVKAAKIGYVVPFLNNENEFGLRLEVEGEPDMVHIVDKAWLERFKPEKGGYLVIYQDGYTSFSPAKAFEEGYTKV